MPRQLAFTVNGIPAPQGSKTRMPNGAMVESSRRVRPWREAIRHEATIAAAAQEWVHDNEPLVLHVVFTLARPRTKPAHPATRPDLDKLLRSTLDGLTDAGAITDDGKVVAVHAVKCYPGMDLAALDTPGVDIVLSGVT